MITEEFHSNEGLTEFVKYVDSARVQLIPDVIYFEGEKNDIPVEVGMCYNTSYSENVHSYVNNINTYEGGTHLTGFKRGLTRTLKNFAEKSGMLNKLSFIALVDKLTCTPLLARPLKLAIKCLSFVKR